MIRSAWQHLRFAARVAWSAFNRFQEHDGPDRAASISYYTLLSLLPLLIFMISLGVGLLGSYDQAFKGALFLVRGIVIPLDQSSKEALYDFVQHATRFRWPGLLLLTWTSRRIFASLISALEKVFGVPSRNFAKHNLLAVALVLLMGVITLVTMAMTMLVATSEGLIERFRGYGAFEMIGSVVLFKVVPAAVTFGFFFLIYRMVPRRVVPATHAAVGAALATLMWEGAKKAFSYYVRNLARYAGVYGALEGVIVLAIWLELSASIVLYCGEVVALISARNRIQRKIPFEGGFAAPTLPERPGEQKKDETPDLPRQRSL